MFKYLIIGKLMIPNGRESMGHILEMVVSEDQSE